MDGFASAISNSSSSLDLTDSTSVLSIIQSTAETTGASFTFEEITNVASIASSIVTTIKSVDTNNTDTSTFSKLEEMTYASEKMAEVIEASGNSITIDIAKSIEDVSGQVDSDNLFEPTQAEKGIRKLQALGISQSVIDDISAISLNINGETIVGNHLDYSSIDSSANVRIARNAVMDILFENDPSAVSFITTKDDTLY